MWQIQGLWINLDYPLSLIQNPTNFSEKGEIIVNKQVLKAFSIEKYKDEILCDVVLMESPTFY